MEREGACDWAIRIYQELSDGLEAQKICLWYDEEKTILNCTDCRVERGCCKKRKLMLAMSSQILDWLKRHQQELADIDFGDDEADAECRHLYPAGRCEVYHRDAECRRLYPAGRYEVYRRELVVSGML